MLLSPDQQQRFRDHLRTAGAREDCMVCHHPIDWVRIAEMAPHAYGFLAVRCICPNCAVITEFAAAALDLVPDKAANDRRIGTPDITAEVIRAIRFN
jgi:hypothetical protein